MIIDSPIVSSSQFISGSSTQVGDAVISGSLTVTGAINATITGSITSASYASFASAANTASYALTASYASNVPQTASNADTASFAFTASNAELLDGRDSLTFAGTASNTFTAPQYVSDTSNASNFISTASLYTDGGFRVSKNAYVSGTIYTNNLTVYGTASVQYTTSSQVDFGTNIITVNTATPAIRFGGYAVFDSGSTGTGLTGSLLWDSDLNRWVYSNPSGSNYDGGLLISGPKNTTGLGNEQGTLNNVITKGQGGDHITSSQITDDGTTVQIPGNLKVTGSITGTITNAVSASYSLTASYAANVPLTASNANTASFAFTASFAQTASFVTTAQTASYVLNAVSSSRAVTSSFAFSASVAVSSSFTTTASFAATASSVNTLNQAVTISGSLGVAGTAGNTVFSSNADTLVFSGSAQFTGSFGITGSLNVTQGITGSISGSALTATSASFATTASFAQTASYIATAQTASFVSTASFATTASFAQTASFITTAQTASYVLNVVSSSYALTASYISGSGAGVGFPFSGSAVITGSLLVTDLSGTGVRYVTTDANGLLVAQTASAAITSTQTSYASAGQTVFPISGGYTTGLVNVFVNGTKLNSTEFTDTSGTNIVLATGSFANDVVEFQKYFPASGVTNNALRQQNYFTATAGQTVFTVPYTPGLLDVFYNGSKLDNTEYTANNGTSITFATASNAGDKIEVDVYSYQVGSFNGIGGGGTGSQVAFFGTSNSISGSNNLTFDGSKLVLTGSFTISGSSTFTNIGPAIFSGSLTSTQGFTGSFSGIATTASYAETLGGTPLSSLATTGSNTLTGTQYISQASNASSFTSTASLYTNGGARITKDLYVSGTTYVNNLTVYGTQSVEYITSSQLNIGDNIITVNTFTPAVRFGGLAVYDSGSTGLTGSILWDSEQNRWIYSNPSGSSYDGGMLISGPRNTSGLGNEQGTLSNYVMKGQGGDHITSSAIYETASLVGIGTNSPSYNLDVSGSGRFTNNVGIGVTLSSWDSAFKALQISGGFAAMGNASAGYVFGNAYNDGDNKYFSTGPSARMDIGNGIVFRVAASGTANTAIAYSAALTLSSTGAATFSSADLATDGLGNVNIFTTDAAATGKGGSLAFGGGTTGGTSPYAFAKIEGIYDGSAAYNGALLFSTNNAGTITERLRISTEGNLLVTSGATIYNTSGNLYMRAGTSGDLILGAGGSNDKMRITSAGNVGINETNPTYPASRNGMTMKAPTTNGTEFVMLSSTDTGFLGGCLVRNGTDFGIINRTNGNLIFATNALERMYITNNGYLWVNGAISGFTASGVQMQVNGQTRFGGDVLLHNGSNVAQAVRLSCNGADSFYVQGALSKNSGSFRIKHPLASKKDTHQLVHSFIEGPQADLIYRGKVRLVAGRATINIDEAATMTEGTFEVLCREVQCFTSNETSWDAVRGKVEGNILTIECQNTESTDEISWLVIGERQDEHMMDTDWTDENGRVIVEPLIPEENK